MKKTRNLQLYRESERRIWEMGMKARCAVLIGILVCSYLAPLAQAASPELTSSNRHERAFVYQHREVPDVPWSIHIMKISRSHSELEFYNTLGKSNVFGMSVVSEQVKSVPEEIGEPIAALNGDFYSTQDRYPGDPRDLQIHNGELVSGPGGHASFWIDTEGNPNIGTVQSRFRVIWPGGKETPFVLNEERDSDSAVLYTAVIGNSTRTSAGLEFVLERGGEGAWLPLQAGKSYQARIKEVRKSGNTPLHSNIMVLSCGATLAKHLPNIEPGTVVTIATETTPDLKGVQMAIGGGPSLVRQGKVMQWNGLQPRHPRSALGWNNDYFYLVEVDGRQNNSVGMSFPELADFMRKLGCAEAMNLDGGGSATFWATGNVMNSPSEGRERPAANALVVLRKKGK
jgi:hypothetical protein